MLPKEDYLKEISKRQKENRIYQKFQLIGLALTEILEDSSHKALYMRIAKNRDGDQLLNLAKMIAEKKNIKNKGAYFMKMLKEEKIKKND